MKSLTAWKVYEYTTNSGETNTVVVGYDSDKQQGIVEPVISHSDGMINDYTLFGWHNYYFEGAQQIWLQYCTANGVNSIKDVSSNY
jgi:hypothetical protein